MTDPAICQHPLNKMQCHPDTESVCLCSECKSEFKFEEIIGWHYAGSTVRLNELIQAMAGKRPTDKRMLSDFVSPIQVALRRKQLRPTVIPIEKKSAEDATWKSGDHP